MCVEFVLLVLLCYKKKKKWKNKVFPTDWPISWQVINGQSNIFFYFWPDGFYPWTYHYLLSREIYQRHFKGQLMKRTMTLQSKKKQWNPNDCYTLLCINFQLITCNNLTNQSTYLQVIVTVLSCFHIDLSTSICTNYQLFGQPILVII